MSRATQTNRLLHRRWFVACVVTSTSLAILTATVQPSEAATAVGEIPACGTSATAAVVGSSPAQPTALKGFSAIVQKVTDAQTTTTAFVPPAGWSASSATDDQIAALGLPSRPSGGAARTHWEQTIGRAHLRAPNFCRDKLASNAQVPANSAQVNGIGDPTKLGYSGNWSGQEAYGTTYQSIYGEFYLANTVNGCADANSSLSTWIGLGGEPALNSGPQLDQVGVVSKSGPVHIAFWELISATADTGEVTFGLNDNVAGDELLTTLSYYPNGYFGETTGPTTRFFFRERTHRRGIRVQRSQRRCLQRQDR